MTDEAQPNGISIEKTRDVVYHILTDPEFCNAVRANNGFPEDWDHTEVAVMFQAFRTQEAVELLSLRTNTLKREVDGMAPTVRQFEDSLAGTGGG